MQTVPVPSLQSIFKPVRHPALLRQTPRRPIFGRRRAVAPAMEMVEEQGEWIISYKDIRQFLMAYTACFVVVMGMII